MPGQVHANLAFEGVRIANQDRVDAVEAVEGECVERVDRAIEDDVANFEVAGMIRPAGGRAPVAIVADGRVGAMPEQRTGGARVA